MPFSVADEQNQVKAAMALAQAHPFANSDQQNELIGNLNHTLFHLQELGTSSRGPDRLYAKIIGQIAEEISDMPPNEKKIDKKLELLSNMITFAKFQQPVAKLAKNARKDSRELGLGLKWVGLIIKKLQALSKSRSLISKGVSRLKGSYTALGLKRKIGRANKTIASGDIPIAPFDTNPYYGQHILKGPETVNLKVAKERVGDACDAFAYKMGKTPGQRFDLRNDCVTRVNEFNAPMPGQRGWTNIARGLMGTQSFKPVKEKTTAAVRTWAAANGIPMRADRAFQRRKKRAVDPEKHSEESKSVWTGKRVVIPEDVVDLTKSAASAPRLSLKEKMKRRFYGAKATAPKTSARKKISAGAKGAKIRSMMMGNFYG